MNLLEESKELKKVFSSRPVVWILLSFFFFGFGFHWTNLFGQSFYYPFPSPLFYFSLFFEIVKKDLLSSGWNNFLLPIFMSLLTRFGIVDSQFWKKIDDSHLYLLGTFCYNYPRWNRYYHNVVYLFLSLGSIPWE